MGQQSDTDVSIDDFEFIKIGALPLITLVISFYFPSSNN